MIRYHLLLNELLAAYGYSELGVDALSVCGMYVYDHKRDIPVGLRVWIPYRSWESIFTKLSLPEEAIRVGRSAP